jgi:DNA-binding NarL/FixJ family response regulator
MVSSFGLGVEATMIPRRELRSPTIPATLTPRETQVLAYVILGKTNREISRELSIAESTVKVHLTSLFVKLEVSTRLEAAIVGWETYPMLRVLVQPHLRLVPGGQTQDPRSS